MRGETWRRCECQPIPAGMGLLPNAGSRVALAAPLTPYLGNSLLVYCGYPQAHETVVLRNNSILITLDGTSPRSDNRM